MQGNGLNRGGPRQGEVQKEDMSKQGRGQRTGEARAGTGMGSRQGRDTGRVKV